LDGSGIFINIIMFGLIPSFIPGLRKILLEVVQMIALVYRGKMKNPELLKKAAEVDDKYLAIATHLFEGFEGGVVLGKDDGTFIDCSYWKDRETVDKLMDNEIVKKVLSFSEELVEGSYSMDYYDILMKY
jgi:hypothetical protein